MITSYKDLSIGKYLELTEILKDETDDLEIQCELLSILSDMDYDSIVSLPLAEYQRMVSQTAFLLEKPKVNKSIPSKIKIGGKTYCITKDVASINVAQYIDYQTYSKQGNDNKSIPQLLSCFIIPEGCKYGEGYDVAEVINIIRDNMSIVDAVSVCFFFHQKYRSLIEDTLIYLAWKIRLMKLKVRDKERKMKMEETMRELKALRDLL